MTPEKRFLCSLFLIYCYAHLVQSAATTTGAPSTTIGEIICKKKEDEPEFMPNIYKCTTEERCCFNEGAPSCCGTTITKEAIIEQAVMWGVLLGVFILVGIIAYCYFNDNYCCDADPDDDERCCGCCSSRKETYLHKIDINEVLYPDEAEARKVDDPIFGKLGKPNDVPQYATIDIETQQRAEHRFDLEQEEEIQDAQKKKKKKPSQPKKKNARSHLA